MPSDGKVSAGQTLTNMPAEVWNGMVAAGNSFRNSILSDGGRPSPRARKTDIIKVKNDSGANRAKGEVLGDFSSLVTTVTAENIRLTADAPAAGKSFGVLLEHVADGSIGELQLSGVCLATVTISDTAHEFADIDPGNYKLISATIGPVQIVFAPAGTGDIECVVRLGSMSAAKPVYHALTKTGGIPARSSTTMGSATCDLLSCSSGGVLSDSGTDVTIYNDIASIVGAVAGTYIKFAFNDAGLRIVITEDCS